MTEVKKQKNKKKQKQKQLYFEKFDNNQQCHYFN
jgi:hypothetical protein